MTYRCFMFLICILYFYIISKFVCLKTLKSITKTKTEINNLFKENNEKQNVYIPRLTVTLFICTVNTD
jgi:hypothetical protein